MSNMAKLGMGVVMAQALNHRVNAVQANRRAGWSNTKACPPIPYPIDLGGHRQRRSKAKARQGRGKGRGL